MSGPRRHALVVGATGLLREVARALAVDHALSLVARDRGRLDAFARELAEAGATAVPIALDYTDTDRLAAELEEAIGARGAFALAVVYLDPEATAATRVVAERLAGAPLFDVLTASAADPVDPRPRRDLELADVPGLRRREVVLGWRAEAGGTRWHDPQELAPGLLEAVRGDLDRHVVGLVRPWSAHPSR